MQTVLVILTVIVSILLIIVVLIQKSKGGGLASNFASGNQMMGVRRTNDFISNATWTLACIILVLSVASSMLTPDTVVKESNLTAPATEQKQAADFSTNAPVAKEAPAPVAEPAATEAPAAEAPAAQN
ncbi:MAG: preprotein translocase subunit SecG [Muribaculaceae bacterium]|nr:preprotein translocase subunit SecG [Muribaculaceae bacterium]